jgi:small subunit ribosomal protein S20
MANTQSAKKRVRASLRKRVRNRAARSAVKTLVARARKPAAGAASMTSDDLRRAISALDKAAEKGTLHRNNASRRKSRLMSAVAKLAPAAPAEKKAATPKAAAPKKSPVKAPKTKA